MKELETAFYNNQFIPFYQPIIDTQQGSTAAFEMLLRLEKDGQIIMPSDFIATLEDSWLIEPVTYYLLEQAFALIAQYQGQFKLSLNVPPQLIASDEIINQIKLYKQLYQPVSNGVILEITERLPVEHIEETIAVIQALQLEGISIYIDDYIPNHIHSTLISHSALEGIKIDRSMTDTTRINQQLSMLDLPTPKAVQWIAEGIDSEDKKQHWQEMGVVLQQGFLFSPPHDEAAISSMLETNWHTEFVN
ncbi:EAL domain-containing protein [Photobacterium sanctipauli]|uniref:EAL domain-containing protein n=1 Tax=Photobacterium sanctipauli TaxID=1342794 RepID=UPI001304D880|nr:EAL domain-containing protein [Photobacterium sanctipauli]